MSCAGRRREGGGTWITSEMKQAYHVLHQAGLAHSIEAWDDQGELAGGLYGVAIGKMFFGESMFSEKPDASKVALVGLTEQLSAWEFPMIDCQVANDHLFSMGARTVARAEFESVLSLVIEQQPSPSSWTSYFGTEQI